MLGEREAALADYNRALDLLPNRARTYFLRGTLYFQWGLAYFQEYLEESPGYFEQALADYQRALELDPNDGDVYVAQAGVFYILGDNEAALGDLKQAETLLGELPADIQALRDEIAQSLVEPTRQAG